jgi:hypothetical protein
MGRFLTFFGMFYRVDFLNFLMNDGKGESLFPLTPGRSPEAPKEQYLDSGLDGDAGQTGAFSPGMPAQKETVTFMVDQQQDFRVWVQQDLPPHPLPQNTTVYPGTIQYD